MLRTYTVVGNFKRTFGSTFISVDECKNISSVLQQKYKPSVNKRTENVYIYKNLVATFVKNSLVVHRITTKSTEISSRLCTVTELVENVEADRFPMLGNYNSVEIRDIVEYKIEDVVVTVTNSNSVRVYHGSQRLTDSILQLIVECTF